MTCRECGAALAQPDAVLCPTHLDQFQRHWDEQERLLNDWEQRVHQAAQAGGRLVAHVHCASCREGRPNAKVVMSSGFGLMLVRVVPAHFSIGRGKGVSVSEWRAYLRALGLDYQQSVRGFPIEPGRRRADLFPWDPDPEYDPHVVCRVHGRIDWTDTATQSATVALHRGRVGSVTLGGATE